MTADFRIRQKKTTLQIRQRLRATGRTSGGVYLALRELEAFTSALLSVLLALMLPRIPSEEAEFLQFAAQLDIELEQRTCNSKAIP